MTSPAIRECGRSLPRPVGGLGFVRCLLSAEGTRSLLRRLRRTRRVKAAVWVGGVEVWRGNLRIGDRPVHIDHTGPPKVKVVLSTEETR